MSRKKLDETLRREALVLVDTGMTSAAVGHKLRVKKMTVAGWRSARTKGFYDGEGVAD